MSRYMVLLFFMMILSRIYSYDMERIIEFSNGNGSFELLYDNSVDPDNRFGPNGMFFDDEGALHIADTWNSRIMVISEDLNTSLTIDVENPSQLISDLFLVQDNKYIISSRFQIIHLLNMNGELIKELDFYNSEYNSYLGEYDNFAIYNDYFIIAGEGNRILYSRLLYEDEGILLWNSDNSEFLSQISEVNSDVFSINQYGLYYLNSKLVTFNYASYINHWINEYEGYGRDQRHQMPPFSPVQTGVDYIGVDHDGNFYWDVLGTIIIFSRSGFVIERFDYDRRKSDITPAVTPSGDIYFLDSSQDGHDLYCIQRQW